MKNFKLWPKTQNRSFLDEIIKHKILQLIEKGK